MTINKHTQEYTNKKKVSVSMYNFNNHDSIPHQYCKRTCSSQLKEFRKLRTNTCQTISSVHMHDNRSVIRTREFKELHGKFLNILTFCVGSCSIEI